MAASSRFVTVNEDEIENFKENRLKKLQSLVSSYLGIIVNFHVVFLSLCKTMLLKLSREGRAFKK